MDDIDIQKQRFLARLRQTTRLETQDDVAQNAIVASLQRNRTYGPNGNRLAFRAALAYQLKRQTEMYATLVDHDTHCRVIKEMADTLSREFKVDLVGGQLRIGTVQKALNLYIKTVWCMELNWPVPPLCPVDGTVLGAARIPGSWTKLESMATYCYWISKLERHAKVKYESLAEWELCEWPFR